MLHVYTIKPFYARFLFFLLPFFLPFGILCTKWQDKDVGKRCSMLDVYIIFICHSFRLVCCELRTQKEKPLWRIESECERASKLSTQNSRRFSRKRELIHRDRERDGDLARLCVVCRNYIMPTHIFILISFYFLIRCAQFFLLSGRRRYCCDRKHRVDNNTHRT